MKYNYPSIFLCLPFCLGIFFSNYININVYILLFLVVIGYIFIFSKKIFNYSVLIISFLLGFSIYKIKNIETIKNCSFEFTKNIYSAEVLDKLSKNEKTCKYILRIKQNNFDIKLISNISNIYKDSIMVGDSIVFDSKINLIPKKDHFDDFNYKEFMMLKGITHTTFISEKNCLKIKKNENNLHTKLNLLKEDIIINLQNKKLSEQVIFFTLAIVFGDKINLDKSLLEGYSDAGVTHILAVSGLHLGILILILMYILSPLDRLKYLKKIKLPIIILIVWAYAFMVNFSPSILRASIMFTFIIIGGNLKRKTNIYNSLFSSAFVLLILNPNNLFDLGFQFSYFALFFIIWLQPFIFNFIKFKNKITSYIWEIISVSISAQLGVLPVSLYYFGKLPLLFLISNIILMPIIGVILFFSLIVVFISFLPYQLKWIYIFYDIIITKVNYIIMFISSFKSTILNFKLEFYEVILFYIITIFLILFSKKRTFFFIKIPLLFVVLFQLLFIINFYKKTNSNEMIYFNTKNKLFCLKNKSKIYILNENTDKYSNDKLSNYIKNNYIKKIEYIDTKKDLCLNFLNKKILISNKNIPKNTYYDFIFIKDYLTFDKKFNTKNLIIDKINKIEKESEINKTPKIYSIYENGSFYFKF